MSGEAKVPEAPVRNASYLGDAVYTQLDNHGRIVLTTGSHKLNEASNTIVLEPEVWDALVNWAGGS